MSSFFSHCDQCGRPLRACVFCPQCRRSVCSLGCLEKHRVLHDIAMRSFPLKRLSPAGTRSSPGFVAWQVNKKASTFQWLRLLCSGADQHPGTSPPGGSSVRKLSSCRKEPFSEAEQTGHARAENHNGGGFGDGGQGLVGVGNGHDVAITVKLDTAAEGAREGRGMDTDRVGIHRHGRRLCQRSAVMNCGGGVKRDAGERQDIALEIRAGSESRRAADLPVQTTVRASVRTGVDDRYHGAAGGRKGAADLKNPERVGTALSIELEGASQLSRAREKIDTGSQRQAAQILAGQHGIWRKSCQSVVRRRVVDLGLLCHGIRIVHCGRPYKCDCPKAGDRRAGVKAHISVDGRSSRVGHGRATEHGEVLRSPQDRTGICRRGQSE